jgi:hypothetical protein
VADYRHKRDHEARRKPKAMAVIGPLAVLATAGAVSLGVVIGDPAVSDVGTLGATAADLAPSRSADFSRSADRTKVPPASVAMPANFMSKASIAKAVAGANKMLWTTDELNIWTQPGDKAKQVGELEAGKKVLVTGRELWGRTEIVLKGRARWVTEGYLSADKPLGVGAGLSMEPCADSGPESGLTDNAVYVYRSVCHAFPEVTSYGGWSNHGEHASGRAIDIMTSDVTLGTAIAEFLRAHASELALYDVIWHQQIWTPERASEGWRYMPSRGSATANHYDHVHVSVY